MIELHVADAIEWLEGKTLDAIITSIPDMSEVNLSEDEYIPFLRKCASSCFKTITEKGYIIFIQTDRKCRGLIDKSYYITDEGIRNDNFRMIYHKIALIRPPDSNDKYRPTYIHILCYSKKGTPGRSTSDVYSRGDVSYKNGSGIEAVRRCVEYIQSKGIDTICDPFCGQGTTLLMAQDMGLNGIGIDICEEQIKIVSEKITHPYSTHHPLPKPLPQNYAIPDSGCSAGRGT